ncbi:SprT-like family-domain-containing protein [Geranomyces variabilis]|nr:SprT-like family-domain-containing protein [Geranomyces variabilis]
MAAGLPGSTSSSAVSPSLAAFLPSGYLDPHTDLLALVPLLEREIEKRKRSLYPFEDPYQFLDPGFFDGDENDDGRAGSDDATGLLPDEEDEGVEKEEDIAEDYDNNDDDDEESAHLDVVSGELHVYEADADDYGLCEGESIQIYVPDLPAGGDTAVHHASIELLQYPNAGGGDERQAIPEDSSREYQQQHQDSRTMLAATDAHASLELLPYPDVTRDADGGGLDESEGDNERDPSEYFSCSDDENEVDALTTTITTACARRRSRQALSGNSSPCDRHRPTPPKDHRDASYRDDSQSDLVLHGVNVVATELTSNAAAVSVASATSCHNTALSAAASALAPNDVKNDDQWSDSSAETLIPRATATAPAAAAAVAAATPEQQHPTDAHDRLFEHVTLRKKKVRDNVNRSSRRSRGMRSSRSSSVTRRESVGSIEFERAVEAAAAAAAEDEGGGENSLSPLSLRARSRGKRSHRRESFQFVDGTLADISPIGASVGRGRVGQDDDEEERDVIGDEDFDQRFERLGIRSGEGDEGEDTAGARGGIVEARVLEDGIKHTKRVEHDSDGDGRFCERSASLTPLLLPSRDKAAIDLTSDKGNSVSSARFVSPPPPSRGGPTIDLTMSNDDEDDIDRPRSRSMSKPHSPPRPQLPTSQRDDEDDGGYASSLSSSSSSSTPTRGLLVFPGTPTKTIPLCPAGPARITTTTPSGAGELRKHTLALAPTPTRKATPSTAAFARKRVALARALFEEFNATAFEGLLPGDLEIAWSRRLNTTAGRCFQSRTPQGDRTARIELSTKVVDTLAKLRSTLAHELCHAAVWLLDTTHIIPKQTPHGPAFRAWGARVTSHHPDITTTACHAYAIAYKYTRSIDVTRRGCGGCGSRLVLEGVGGDNESEGRVRVKKDGTPAKVNRYTVFVKENFGRLKVENPGMEVREVMRLVGRTFRAEQQARDRIEGGGGGGGEGNQVADIVDH